MKLCHEFDSSSSVIQASAPLLDSWETGLSLVCVMQPPLVAKPDCLLHCRASVEESLLLFLDVKLRLSRNQMDEGPAALTDLPLCMSSEVISQQTVGDGSC